MKWRGSAPSTPLILSFPGEEKPLSLSPTHSNQQYQTMAATNNNRPTVQGCIEKLRNADKV